MTVTLGHLADMIGGTVLPAESGGPADPPIAAVELNAAETPEGGLFAAPAASSGSGTWRSPHR